MNTVQLLTQFAQQRPSLDIADYENRKAYMQDYRGILADLHSFRDLMQVCTRRIDNFDEKLKKHLENSSDRLTLKDGKLQYITGQYWPTEYRNAACRVLARLIWEDFREEKYNEQPVYKDGHQIRAAINRNFKSRNTKLYFA